MKNKFRAYYRLSEQQLKDLFADCLFVLDTNVVLDCVRMRPDLADKLMEVFESLGKRIRIPAHVAYEYHKHATEEVAKNLQKLRNYKRDLTEDIDFKSFVPVQYSLYLDSKQLSKIEESFNQFKNSLFEEIDNKIDHWEEEYNFQHIQDRIASKFSALMLKDVDEQELDKRKKEANRRIDEKLPPGFKDSGKGDNKEGDFLIWSEILDLAVSESKSIVFISEDLKEDWLQKGGGLDLGPHPLLRKEFYDKFPKGEVHFYNIAQFLRFADPDNKIFSTDEIDEIEKRRKLLKQESDDQKAEKNSNQDSQTKNKKQQKGQ